ncbi:hypothetical protein FSP39_014809 [Pinctada imbricata]|uniref:C1q domain-containing protein n=1 Tax=Pinctada imbricata TaxID=66713 RepID=A0AA88YHH8_PINIB|nr:hypothetical protein FSP39_014809 [Pinctada imbricata]
MVGFTACHSKGSTFAAYQTIIYDHIITNIGNAYDVRDGEFNVPYDGLYTFTVTGMAYSNTEMYFTLLKNGVYVQKMYSNLDTSDTSAFTTNLYLQAGDAIWVVNGGHDSGHLHPNNYNCFSVNNSTQHMVAFTACHSKGSTIGVHQTVLYDHVITNIGNAYDVRDGEFNVPYDGLYTFSITGMAYGNTDMYLTLFKNGVYVQKLYSNIGNADSSSLLRIFIFKLVMKFG